jgi:hypothetical protein
MHIFRSFAQGTYGSDHLGNGRRRTCHRQQECDIEEAALGHLRSLSPAGPEKGSRCSRVFIEKPVFRKCSIACSKLNHKIRDGDPTHVVYTSAP